MVSPFNIAWNLLKQDNLISNTQGIPSETLFELAALGEYDPKLVEMVLGENRRLTQEESMRLLDHAVAVQQREEEEARKAKAAESQRQYQRYLESDAYKYGHGDKEFEELLDPSFDIENFDDEGL